VFVLDFLRKKYIF